MLKRVLRSLLRVGTLRAQYSKCHSRHFFISSTRGTSGHWKDDVVEPERDSQRLYNNTRARGCACILYYLATVKAFYRVSVSPNSRRRLFWWIYPPKLSNMIMSSSTPKEWSKSSTVLDIIGGPRRKWLARRNSHASLACRTSSSPQKLKILGDPAYYGYLCGSSPMKKTILDLLHSNESKRNIMYDDFGNQYGK